jgi:hypothetical protein
MFVTETVEFNKDTLDTSVEKFLMLALSHDPYEAITNTKYLIIMDHIVKYLKNHNDSKICEKLETKNLLFELERRCRNLSFEQSAEYEVFEASKRVEFIILAPTSRYYTSNQQGLFKVWFYINRAIIEYENTLRGIINGNESNN